MGIPKIVNRKMMTMKEIASAIKTSVSTVRKIIHEQKIPHEVYGIAIVVDKDNLFRIRQEAVARKEKSLNNLKNRKRKTLPPNTDNVIQIKKVDTSNERIVSGMERIILELDHLKTVHKIVENISTKIVENISTTVSRTEIDTNTRLENIENFMKKLAEAWGIKIE